eukprot:NODE_939_length_2915_cov_0.365412.p1 type:complete len:217 gc:universal NODE_939_length_2915_cov_0.365412:1100-450(-)
MNKLLHWSMENKDKTSRTDEKISKEKIENLDTKWIDVILGKTDAVHIQEQFEEIKASDIENQRQILADLEEYCWDLDKANAVQDWKYLTELLENEELKDLIYSLFGTIMQNNEQSQKLFLNYVNWNTLFNDLMLNQIIVNKIMYYLCSVMPSHRETIDSFIQNNGFTKVLHLLSRDDIDCTKVAYFLNKNHLYVKPLLKPEHVLVLKGLKYNNNLV